MDKPNKGTVFYRQPLKINMYNRVTYTILCSMKKKQYEKGLAHITGTDMVKVRFY